MEKFFIVSNDSNLGREYWAYQKNRDIVREHVKEFMEQHGIEAKTYSPAPVVLYIEPTAADMEKFKGLFKVGSSNGLKAFKQNSVIGKAWVKSLSDKSIKIVYKPYIPAYFPNAIGRMRNRLFHIGETIYCSFEAEGELGCPDGFTEIKASEFWKIVEDTKEK